MAKRILVTGATGNLGSRVAERAASVGWSVVGTYLRAASEVADEQLDVRDAAAVRELVRRVRPDKENRETQGKLPMPVLVLNGENGLPQAPLLDGARHAASDVLSDTVPRTGHAYAAENPGWTVERLHRFFSDSDA